MPSSSNHGKQIFVFFPRRPTKEQLSFIVTRQRKRVGSRIGRHEVTSNSGTVIVALVLRCVEVLNDGGLRGVVWIVFLRGQVRYSGAFDSAPDLPLHAWVRTHKLGYYRKES